MVTCLPTLQISCLSASAALNDRTKYKRHFQLLNSYDTLAYAYYGVIKEYGWTHVELIVQDENLFTEVHEIVLFGYQNQSLLSRVHFCRSTLSPFLRSLSMCVNISGGWISIL